MLQDYYTKASWFKKLLIKGGILYGGILLTMYVIFRASYINLTPALAVFAVILFMAELHTVIHLYGFFYSLWPRKYKVYDKPNNDKNLQVNMWITCAGEPSKIVRETVKHAKIAADHYEKTVHPYHKPR